MCQTARLRHDLSTYCRDRFATGCWGEASIFEDLGLDAEGASGEMWVSGKVSASIDGVGIIFHKSRWSLFAAKPIINAQTWTQEPFDRAPASAEP